MTSQFDLIRFYDVITCKNGFQIGFFISVFQIQKELAAAQFKLTEMTITKFVQKLFDLEIELISKFSLYNVQEDWFLKTRNHLEKYERKLRLKKLKKI